MRIPVRRSAPGRTPVITLGRSLRPLWALEEDIVYLAHGACGATPRDLLRNLVEWRERIEAQPVRFFMEEWPELLRESTAALAGFVGADPKRTVLVESATSGIDAVLRSLSFAPGDRIITTNHVYGAVRQILRIVAGRTGAEIVEVPLPMPVEAAEQVTQSIENALDERIRLVLVDHIASPSALHFPVGDIVRLCRSRDVLVLVDGAQAPGHIDLAVDAIGADWYVGNGHKWLCGPKGIGFVVAGAGTYRETDPAEKSDSCRRGMAAEFGQTGARDPVPWLCIADAIHFHERLGGAALRRRNAQLVAKAAGTLAREIDAPMGGPPEMFGAMATIAAPELLPATPEVARRLCDRLWHDHRVEMGVVALAGRIWLRISVSAYNDERDFDGLAAALRETFRVVSREVV